MNLNIKSEAAAGAVAGAAFLASAGHIVSVVDETNPIWFALAYPIGIDGLVFVGIRALQTKRIFAGSLALLIGAIYSLAFNGHAEDAFTMPPLMIASAMPVCMFAAFLIEATAAKTEIEPETIEVIREVEKVVEVEKIVHVLPDLLPIVPFVKPAAPKAPKTETKTDAPRTQAGSGRMAAWDVEKAVRLAKDGRTDVEILDLVDGLTAKPWQRTKRAIKIITEDASTPDETISETVGQSVAHITRIRAAMKENA